MSTSKETDPTEPAASADSTDSAAVDADGFVVHPEAAAVGDSGAAGMVDDQADSADSEYDDPRRPLLRALKFGSVALLLVTIISLVIWGAVADLPGIWGVLIGAAIGGGFVLLTVISMLATSRTDAITTAVVVLVGWLIKIVIMILILWILSGLTFYNTWALAVTIIVSLVIVLVTETWGVVTSRVTYVS